MYFAFNNDFLNQWHDPTYVEKKRKEEEQKRRNSITRLNMEQIEKCIKKNSIDELDRTKPYDKTFICDNFISYSTSTYMSDVQTHVDEMKDFTEIIKPELKKINLDYTDTAKVDVKNDTYHTKYTFNSNIIPKNTFTNLSTVLLFRISNTYIDNNPKQMHHTIMHTVYPEHDEE
jgi:hypothetical protein